MHHFLWLGLSDVERIVKYVMGIGGFDVWEEQRRRLSCVSRTDWLLDVAGGIPRLGGSKRGKGLQIRETLLWINSSSSTDIFLERKKEGN